MANGICGQESSRYGQAWREISALRPEILRRLEAGQTKRTIYLVLKSSGLITVTQSSFYDAMGKLQSQLPQSPIQQQQPAPSTVPGGQVQPHANNTSIVPPQPMTGPVNPKTYFGITPSIAAPHARSPFDEVPPTDGSHPKEQNDAG